MIVVGNELHPALIPGSTDRTRRSGVGACEGGQVRFAISDDEVAELKSGGRRSWTTALHAVSA